MVPCWRFVGWAGCATATRSALQQGLFRRPGRNYLLLLEHEPTFTLGLRGNHTHLKVPPEELGGELIHTDRGGDVTYHGPGQLVGYPILDVPGRRRSGQDRPASGLVDTRKYVAGVAQLVIDVLEDLGLPGCFYDPEYPGVWAPKRGVGIFGRPRKIAAVGVKLSRGRSMHGFALNVTYEPLPYFDRIVPCGLADKFVTSMFTEGIPLTMPAVVEAVAARAVLRWGSPDHSDSDRSDLDRSDDGLIDRADVHWRPEKVELAPFSLAVDPTAAGVSLTPGFKMPWIRPDAVLAPPRADLLEDPTIPSGLQRRRVAAGVTEGLSIRARKPSWLKAPVRHDASVLGLRKLVRSLDLVTVCEEAGCPNLSECWADGTATFMINGERCTRACGFCMVDTSKPMPLDPAEPKRLARAVARLGLRYAVVTAVARDDLADGGAAAFAQTIGAIRELVPGCQVEVLFPDCKGDPEALQLIFDARPDVANHNIETVARLQRLVRPSASYARSLGVLSRAKGAGLVTKSSIIVGMGESDREVRQTLDDLAAIGTDIVTIGQYLRPSARHLPVVRWVPPDTFTEWANHGQAAGIHHVEASPLTRSSYHARQAAHRAGAVTAPAEHPRRVGPGGSPGPARGRSLT